MASYGLKTVRTALSMCYELAGSGFIGISAQKQKEADQASEQATAWAAGAEARQARATRQQHLATHWLVSQDSSLL